MNPETAATEDELFRKMNESEDFKKEILKGAMALQHGIASQLYRTDFRFHAILSRNQRNPSGYCKSVSRIEKYFI